MVATVHDLLVVYAKYTHIWDDVITRVYIVHKKYTFLIPQ